MKSSTSLVTFLAAVIAPAHGEFRRFDGDIDAASNYIHYSEGYVVTPGYVDISNLMFETVDDGAPGKYDAQERDWDDDDEGLELEEVDDAAFDDDGDDDGGEGTRRLDGKDVDAALSSGSTVGLLCRCNCTRPSCVYHI